MNIFDSLKRAAFDTITRVMGYDAVWVSESGTFTSEVGYKDPSEKQELSGIDSWNPNQPFMEYRKGFFDGLKESVDAGNPQFVTITQRNDSENIVGYFNVKEVQTKYDGETFIARLIKTTPE